MPAAPEVTVVVPAYRAAATIGRTLSALRAQRGAPEFEVIVVDSSPDESTTEAARRALAEPEGASRPEHRVVHLAERAFPGAARNRGAAMARAPLLLFVDADAIPAPDLVLESVRAVAGEADVAGGSIALAPPASVSARLRHLLQFKESLPGVPRRATWTLASACVVYRRATFERYGGFPDVRASEDWLLHWRMWQAGERLVFEPRMAILHETPSGWRAFARAARLLGYHSGVARRSSDLPGRTVVRRPLLAAGLPLARTMRAFVWCARYAPSELAFLSLTWPAYLVMCSIWASGFAAGLRGETAERKRLARDLPL